MGVKRKATKSKGKSSANKQQQQQKKTSTVALRLVWYCLLSVLALVLVTAFAILHPVLLWAPQAALGKSLTATLPGLALIHISSVAMVIAAVCAALAENACGPSHKHKHTSTGTGAMRQALIVGVKLVLYNGAGLLFAACIHAVATSSLFWRVCKEFCSQMSPVPTEVQAVLFTLAFAGLCALLEESTSPNSNMGQQIRTAIASLTEAIVRDVHMLPVETLLN